MFHHSPRIDSRLADEVAAVERQVPGYQVLSAHLYTAPVAYFRASCEVLQTRRLNLIEEFALQSAIELSPAATSIELANALGVDEKFIGEVTGNFTEKLSAIKMGAGSTLIATEKGKEFYRRKQIPQPPRLEALKIAYFTPYYSFIALPNDYQDEAPEIAPLLPGVPPLEEATLNPILAQMNKNTIAQATQAAGNPIHSPDNGQSLGALRSIEFTHQGFWNWAVLTIWDALEKQVFIRLSNLSFPSTAAKEIRGFALDEWLEDANTQLDDLLQLDDDAYQDFTDFAPINRSQLTETQSRSATVARLVENELRELRNPSGGILNRSLYEGGIAEILPQIDVPDALQDALKQARARILIVAPRLNEQTLSDGFIHQLHTLATRRVITVIGWGAASQYSEEDNTPSLQLLSRLSEIKTPEGLPAVIVMWLGSQYSKDVIVDNRLHLCSTANWVQYRDNDLPGVETVYKITINEEVMKAAGTIEQLFFEHAAAHWENRIQNPVKETDLELLSAYLAAFSAIGRFSEAAGRAVSLTQAPHRHFLPLIRLCRSAGEMIYGINVETRHDLLQAIGDEWQRLNNLQKLAEIISEDDQAALNMALSTIMEQLGAEDEIALRTTLESYQAAWQGFGLLKEGQSIDSFVEQLRKQRAISGTGRLKTRPLLVE